jgi:hypothetical protein
MPAAIATFYIWNTRILRVAYFVVVSIFTCLSSLQMEIKCSSEMSVLFRRITWLHFPENRDLFFKSFVTLHSKHCPLVPRKCIYKMRFADVSSCAVPVLDVPPLQILSIPLSRTPTPRAMRLNSPLFNCQHLIQSLFNCPIHPQ